MSHINLDYVKETIEIGSSKFGLPISENVDVYYKDKVIRNRVILKLDIVSSLTEYFDEATLSNYRNLVFQMVAGGITNPNLAVKTVNTLYQADTTFKFYLGNTFYFNQDTKEKPLYGVIVKGLIQEYFRQRKAIEDNAIGFDYKLLIESNGYYYISGRDLNQEIIIPEGFKEEVLSNARTWSGKIKRAKSSI